MRRRWLIAASMKLPVAMVGLGLAGCGLSERPYLERRDWPLTVPPPAREGASVRGRTLLLRGTQAGPGLEARGLQSLQPDGSVRTDYYESWSVPPAQGAEATLRQWLEASGRFSAVLAPGSRMSADWVMETTLTALVADPTHNVARASLSMVVLDQRTGTPRVLAQRVFSAEAPLTAGAEVPARVAAMRTALGSVFEQILQSLGNLP